MKDIGRKHGVSRDNLILNSIMIFILYIVVCFISMCVSSNNIYTIRSKMSDQRLQRIKVDDFTIARDGVSFFSDIYIFKGDEKLLIDNGRIISDFTNWYFPFVDGFYVYTNTKKIAKKYDAIKEKRLKAKYKRMVN